MADEKPLDENIICRVKKELSDAIEHERKNFREHPREFEEALDELVDDLLNRTRLDDPSNTNA